MGEPADPTSAAEQVLESSRSGGRGWDEARSDDHDFRIYGNTAVVIGRWRARGINAGQPFDYAARYVSVWVKSEGEWRMVSDQSTPIATGARKQQTLRAAVLRGRSNPSRGYAA